MNDKSSRKKEDASDPKVAALLDQADEILTAKLDPLMRETYSADPEKLAEWDALMREYADVAQEPEAPHTASESLAENEAEEARLSQEISERMDMISSDLDRFVNREPPDLELDAALERNFLAMHELDAVMRQRCRDYPGQLAKWEEVVDYLEEVETRYKAMLEAEDAQPGN
jgi:hypothetical protein